jgi:molybdopterin synthase catalytic subunit
MPGLIDLTAGPIDVGAVTASVSRAGAGAIVTFCGVVRDQHLGRDVRYLEYEAYPEMACEEMERVAREAESRWPEARVAIVHRTGRLEIGEASVVIAASAPHRAQAYAASRFAIDDLKETVPIWKKEVWSDGSAWVGAAEPDDGMRAQHDS